MKASWTIKQVAEVFELSRRQAYRKLVLDGVIKPKGRRRTHRIPLSRLLAAYGDEMDSASLAQRLAS